MRITVIGAPGMAGSRVTTEAARRGHEVTAVSRSGTDVPGARHVIAADATDLHRMRELFTGADAVVGSARPAIGREDDVVAVTTTLLDAAAAADVPILFVGGAGPLRSPRDPELLVAEDPEWVPVEYRAIARASVTQWRICRTHAANWTYLSPSAVLAPGERTGRHRLGTTTLLVGSDGTSRVSAEDLASAVVDDLEADSGPGRHITVGY